MYRVNLRQHVLAQVQMETLNVGFQLFHRRCAQQGAGHKRLTAYEGQCHLGRIEPVTLRNINVGRDGFLRLLAAIAGKAAEERITRAGWLRAVQVFTRQRTKAQAGIGEQLNLCLLYTSRCV